MKPPRALLYFHSHGMELLATTTLHAGLVWIWFASCWYVALKLLELKSALWLSGNPYYNEYGQELSFCAYKKDFFYITLQITHK